MAFIQRQTNAVRGKLACTLTPDFRLVQSTYNRYFQSGRIETARVNSRPGARSRESHRDKCVNRLKHGTAIRPLCPDSHRFTRISLFLQTASVGGGGAYASWMLEPNAATRDAAGHVSGGVNGAGADRVFRPVLDLFHGLIRLDRWIDEGGGALGEKDGA